MTIEIIRHLILGWWGFLALLQKAQAELGEPLPEDLVRKLLDAHKIAEDIIARENKGFPRSHK